MAYRKSFDFAIGNLKAKRKYKLLFYYALKRPIFTLIFIYLVLIPDGRFFNCLAHFKLGLSAR